MSVIKTHTHVIIKVMLNQFVSAIFGLVLFMSTYQNPILCLASSVLAIGFYLFLTYSVMWEAGAKDAVSVNCPKQSAGIILILFAQIPSLLATLSHFISSFFLSEGETFIDSLYAATYVIDVMFIQSMYSGLLNFFTPDGVKIPAFAILLTVIPAIVAGIAAYLCGRRGLRVFPESRRKNK